MDISDEERVLGIDFGDGVWKAYPVRVLLRRRRALEDRTNGKVRRLFCHGEQSTYVLDEDGRPVPALNSLWRNWLRFHPDTLVYAG